MDVSMAKIALLIGISEYEPGLNSLPAALNDVRAMQQILESPDLGKFDEVKALTNLGNQVIQYEIETVFSGRSKDDLILFFFSGHGIKDENGRLHFAARNTRKNSKNELIRSTAVPANFVHDVMNGSRAKRQVIILDCCFSGAFDPVLIPRDDSSVNLQEQLGAEGRVVLTSSSSTQYSFEQQGSNLSIYTRYLVEGIETGAGDQNNDGYISILELHDYASSKVRETAPSMTPKIIVLKDKGFEIVLAKAKVSDPRLKYRKEAQKYASRGEITPVGRMILDRHQIGLKLSLEEATSIEEDVLRPYRERLDNLEHYKAALVAAMKYQYPIDETIRNELKSFQQLLGLRNEDIYPIENGIVAQLKSLEQESLQEKTPSVEEGLEPLSTKTLYLRIIGSPYAYEVPDNLETISVGRQRRKPNSPGNEGNDVVIRVPESDQKSLRISRKHLEIKKSDFEYFLVDRSGGRTRLNGNNLDENQFYKLNSHDKLSIADVLELEVLIQAKLEYLATNRSSFIEVDKPDESQPKLIVEASVGDMVTVSEASIGDVATVDFD